MEAEYMNRIQLYLENSVQKYPLDDDTSGDIAKDILLDMSLSVPAGTECYLTNLVRTDHYLFLSIENDSGAVAHFFTADPTPFRMHRLTMHADGNGWVVFGPGAVAGRFRHALVRERVDSRCLLPNHQTVRQFRLEVNGVEYDMPNILRIESNYFISVTRESRLLAPEGENPCLCLDGGCGSSSSAPSGSSSSSEDSRECIVLGRNDPKLSDTIIKTGLTVIWPFAMPLLTLNNVPPDQDGNMEIAVGAQDPSEKAWLVPVDNRDGDPIGFVIVTRDMQGCRDEYARLLREIRKSDTGEGVPYPLPLDCIFDNTCPETYPS